VFHFVMPRADGTVYHLTLGGKDLDHAFQQFRDGWWTETDHTRCVGIWLNSALVAYTMPIVDPMTGLMTCFMVEIKP